LQIGTGLTIELHVVLGYDVDALIHFEHNLVAEIVENNNPQIK